MNVDLSRAIEDVEGAHVDKVTNTIAWDQEMQIETSARIISYRTPMVSTIAMNTGILINYS